MSMVVGDEPYSGFVPRAVIFVAWPLLGFASHSPGGLGVFDAAMLIALWQFDTEDLLAGPLLFRLLLYLLPVPISLAIPGGPQLWFHVISSPRGGPGGRRRARGAVIPP